MNTTKKVTRRGAGRTKGSFSFTPLTLAQLQLANSNTEFKWLVSRKQAEAMGIAGLVTSNIGDLKDSISGQSEETKAKVLVSEL